jgi:putative ABC transport system permease protein
MKYFSLIWSNVWRKKIRTTLTVLSVLVAFLLFGLLSAFKMAFTVDGTSLETAERVVTTHKISLINLLPISYLERIRQVPGVATATHSTWFGAYYQEPRNQFAQFPVDAESYIALYPETEIPKDQLDAWLNNRTGAIVGRAIANQFDLEVGDRLPLTSTIWRHENGTNNWEFTIDGIADDSSGNANTAWAIFHYDYFDEARAGGKGMVGWFIEKGDGSRPTTEIAADIDMLFANSPAETKTNNESAFASEYMKQFGDIGLVVTAILGAVFFTILLVNGNTMAQSVRERIPELAVLKTLGYSSGSILGMVLSEGVIIAALGGLLGIGAAKLALIPVSAAMAAALPGGLNIPASTIWTAVGFMLLVGFGSGILPAVQAMRLTIVQALARR